MPLRSLRWSDVESKRSLAGLVLLIALAASGARADVPYPTCADAGCADPSDFGAYLFLAPDQLPDDFDPLAGSSWKYNPGTGMSIPGAWRITL